ncbi:MAG: altronate dehydratase family protein [Opitutaceae bacterium]|jgi:altronate hydrolase
MTTPLFLRIHPADNVAVALRPAEAGVVFDGVPAIDPIPAGHKLALTAIAVGEPVVKYGYPIGVASVAIPAGAHVHSHNVRGNLPEKLASLRFAEIAKPAPFPTRYPLPATHYFFQGYRRPDGRAATRNEIWIVNTVGCVNVASEKIAAAANTELATPGSGIDGVHAFPHPFGCSQLGDDLGYTKKVLAGLARHPNAAAVLVLGLGCENNQMKAFLEFLGPQAAERIRWFNAQQVSDEIESGVEAVRELAAYVRQFKRQPIPASELILGMKCGGSDGFSGITANPLVGRIADRHSAAGGTVLLTEVPEMFGAERMLLERTTNEATFNGVIDLVNDFRAYFQKHNEPIDENPSPGNKDGGITTLADKSLGCVQKAGQAPIAQVLAYGASAQAGLGGVALVQGPGNDGVSGTAMTVAGAHLLLFTTGRGNPMGFPVPTLKISSNTDLATRKPQWIDFNAGPVADGTAGFEQLTDELWQRILDIASGRIRAQNEIRGHREIAIWKDGVTL